MVKIKKDGTQIANKINCVANQLEEIIRIYVDEYSMGGIDNTADSLILCLAELHVTESRIRKAVIASKKETRLVENFKKSINTSERK